jgi:hypothetical protein
MQTQTNAKQQVSKSAKRRQRQRKRAINRGAAAPQKSVQRNTPKSRGPRRGRGNRGGPLGTDWNPRGQIRGSIFETMDPFGAGWEEKSGMLGVGNTRGIRQTRRDMVIEESEFVAAVTVANQPNFNNIAYPINPGQALLFPWLSTIAKQFERYQFEKLAFIFKKEVSEFNAAGAAGKVIMSVDFDAADPPPGTKQQMEDTVPHADAMPCQSFSLPISPLDLNSTNTLGRFVRTGGLPGGTDIKTTDVGNLNVATQGVPSNVEIGELHVAYRIRLIKPVLENLAGAPANNQATMFITTAPQALISTNVKVLPGGGAGSVNGLGIALAGGVSVPPPGNYLIDGVVQFAASGNSTDFTAYLSKNGGAAIGSSIEYTLPTGAYPIWTCTIPSTFVSCNGTDTIELIVASTFSTGASTAVGFINFEAI